MDDVAVNNVTTTDERKKLRWLTFGLLTLNISLTDSIFFSET